jgi:hypothetical protein
MKMYKKYLKEDFKEIEIKDIEYFHEKMKEKLSQNEIIVLSQLRDKFNFINMQITCPRSKIVYDKKEISFHSGDNQLDFSFNNKFTCIIRNNFSGFILILKRNNFYMEII